MDPLAEMVCELLGVLFVLYEFEPPEGVSQVRVGLGEPEAPTLLKEVARERRAGPEHAFPGLLVVSKPAGDCRLC